MGFITRKKPPVGSRNMLAIFFQPPQQQAAKSKKSHKIP